MPDFAPLGGGDDREEFRMQGRLTTADLQQVGLALAGNKSVEHPLDRRERQLSRQRRRRAGETGRARQVAGLVDLDQRQTALLLVVGTETAIVRATLVDA